MQRDTLGANQIDEATDGGECIAGADGDEHVIAFAGVHVGLGRFHERPGQVGCVYVSHCNCRVVAISHLAPLPRDRSRRVRAPPLRVPRGKPFVTRHYLS